MKRRHFILDLPLHGRISIEETSFQVINAFILQGWQNLRRWRWEEWQLRNDRGEEFWLSYSDDEGAILLHKLPDRMRIHKNASSISYNNTDYPITDSIKAKCIFEAATGRAPLQRSHTNYLTADSKRCYLSLEIDESGAELFLGKRIAASHIRHH